MTLLHRLASVVNWIWHRDRAEQRLDDELRAYVEMSTADKILDGMSPEEARRFAMIELGGLEQSKERVRRYRHGGGLDEIGRDVRYAFRLFGRNPGFTLVIVVTLALGIGTNTAIFSLIDALMLRWLPVRSPQELVQISLQPRGATQPGGESLSYAIVGALAERPEVFSGVAGFGGWRFEVGPPGAADRVHGAVVTGGFYHTLGLNPILGRLITKQDDTPGAPLVAVLSYGYWEQQFARNPNVIGQSLRINGVPVSIIGVSPPGFVGANVGATADITMAVASVPQVTPTAAELLGPGNFWLRVLARPQPDLSNEQAAARLNTLWPQIADAVIAAHWPASRRKEMAESVFHLTPGGTGWTYLREIYTKPLFVLMAVVGLVLLIACANVASLLLARASVRRREMAVRLAMGAGRGRIVRQLLIESTLLSSIGASAGIALAWLSGQFLIDLISSGPAEIVVDLTPNAHVLVFTAVMAMATGILFGLAPAFHATAARPSAALKDDSRTSGPRSRLLPWLVTLQVAISLVLLAGAALFVRTLQNLQNLDPGFRAEGVLLAELNGRQPAFPLQIIDDIRGLPGIISAALTTHTPLSGARWTEPAVPAGQPVPERDNALFVGAGPRFFETMQMQLLAGREFAESDTASRPGVAIVNEAFAARHFPGTNPVGQHLATKLNGQPRDLEIVGLVRNTRWTGLRSAPYPTVYVAYTQITGDTFSTVAVRASGGLGALTSGLKQSLQSKVREASFDVLPLSTQVAHTLVQERMLATLAGAFGLLALTLVCVGMYGLLAYSVAERTKEIGIRMALGAQAVWVVQLVLRDGARLIAMGVALGLPAAWLASRWTKSMLFGVTPMDPAAIGGALALLAAAALVASYLPARRASRLDPLTALRHE
jgi:putative ABC transport system permease protein